MNKLTFGLITFFLLTSCSNSTYTVQFQSTYNGSTHIIKMSNYDGDGWQSELSGILDKLNNEAFTSLFDTNAIFFSQLYYLSFSGEFDTYGVPYYENDFALFSSSNDDFLMSPVEIFKFNFLNDEYFVLYSEKTVYLSDSEEYRPNVEVFHLKQKTFNQLGDMYEHFSINGSVTNEWRAINDLYDGEVSSLFQKLDELTFLTNEIILSIAFLHYEDPLFTNFRLIARFMSISSLGVEYDAESKILKYRRKRERRCWPSLSNCQSIETLPRSNYSFDFDMLSYTYGQFDGSRYTETKHELNYNLHFNFSKELLDSLLEQKTYQDYYARLNQIYSQNSMSQKDQIKLFFLNF
jgi:hypothetical protein